MAAFVVLRGLVAVVALRLPGAAFVCVDVPLAFLAADFFAGPCCAARPAPAVFPAALPAAFVVRVVDGAAFFAAVFRVVFFAAAFVVAAFVVAAFDVVRLVAAFEVVVRFVVAFFVADFLAAAVAAAFWVAAFFGAAFFAAGARVAGAAFFAEGVVRVVAGADFLVLFWAVPFEAVPFVAVVLVAVAFLAVARFVGAPEVLLLAGWRLRVPLPEPAGRADPVPAPSVAVRFFTAMSPFRSARGAT